MTYSFSLRNSPRVNSLSRLDFAFLSFTVVRFTVDFIVSLAFALLPIGFIDAICLHFNSFASQCNVDVDVDVVVSHSLHLELFSLSFD